MTRTTAAISSGQGGVKCCIILANKVGQVVQRGAALESYGIVCVLAAAVLMTLGNAGSRIMSWSFLSLALRSTGGFFPQMAAMFFPCRIAACYAEISILIGPAVTLLGRLILLEPLEPFWFGIAASFLVFVIGFIVSKPRTDQKLM